MLKSMVSLEEAGIYSIAWRFTLPFVLIINAFNSSWAPFKFKAFKEDKEPQKFFQFIFKYYLAGISSLWFVIAVWGPGVLKLVINERFHVAADLIPLTALIPFAQGIRLIMGIGLGFVKSPKFLPLISSAGLAVLISMAYKLIPGLQSKGAAIATFSGWLIMAMLSFVYSQRVYPIKYAWKSAIFIALTAVCLFGMTKFLNEYINQVIIDLILTLTYLVSVSIILFGSSDQKQNIHQIINRVKSSIQQ